jgi:ketosteroid isomerase-like protein
MRMRSAPDAADLEAVRRWFARLAECVRAVDYAAAFPLFAEDLIAFGTYNDFVTGRAEVMRAQWMNVWPTIREFRWRLDEVAAIVSPDRLSATGLAVFESDGFHRDGGRFDRPGRATVALARAETGADWVAVHTHMSLFRGTPGQSFGQLAAG